MFEDCINVLIDVYPVRIGPLHREKQYEVSAEKAGYVLEKEKEDPLVFTASKLGEISVQVCHSGVNHYTLTYMKCSNSLNIFRSLRSKLNVEIL
jgi:hypothetical protein